MLDAYVAVMRHVGHWTRVAQKKRLDLTATFDPPIADPTPDEVDYTSEALSGLVASPSVEALVIEFNKNIGTLLAALGGLRVADSMRDPGNPGSMEDARWALETAKSACTTVVEVGEQVRQGMRAEL